MILRVEEKWPAASKIIIFLTYHFGIRFKNQTYWINYVVILVSIDRKLSKTIKGNKICMTLGKNNGEKQHRRSFQIHQLFLTYHFVNRFSHFFG